MQTSAPRPPSCSSRGANGAENSAQMQQAGLFDLKGLVAGVDEAGRGPLAGPVVAAAVILRPDAEIEGLDDSKKLSAAKRDRLAREIRDRALCWAVGWAAPAEIDDINILAATMLAMRRAIVNLSVRPDGVQVDGNRLPNLVFGEHRLEGDAIIGGDGKTTRDGIMSFLDRLHPEYEFARHKGYCTQQHLLRLQQHGPCIQHRNSFAPVRAVR